MGDTQELTTVTTNLPEPGFLQAVIDFVTTVPPAAAMFTLSVGVIGVSALALYIALVALKKEK